MAPPRIPAGVPATVLARQPDVSAAQKDILAKASQSQATASLIRALGGGWGS